MTDETIASIERLNASILKAQTLFRDAGFTTPASVPLIDRGNEPADHLEWVKDGSEWLFYVLSLAHPHNQPLLKMPLAYRIVAAKRMPALWEACMTAQANRVVEVKVAADTIDAFLRERGKAP